MVANLSRLFWVVPFLLVSLYISDQCAQILSLLCSSMFMYSISFSPFPLKLLDILLFFVCLLASYMPLVVEFFGLCLPLLIICVLFSLHKFSILTIFTHSCDAFKVVEDGYEFFAKRQLVTIFSAPNYCGEFDNAGAMMSVDDTLTCSFQILKASEKKGRFDFGNTMLRPGTPPHKVNGISSVIIH